MEFRCDKRKKKDVQLFEWNLEDNLFRLQWELANGFYRHSPYSSFTICDPKQRSIHKASVRDRVLHHGIFRALYPFYDPTLIDDTYACRNGKGSHAAVVRLSDFLQKESRNFRRPAYALKCDIRKFFASVNHDILKNILTRGIKDTRLLQLLFSVIDSYAEAPAERERESKSPRHGLPIGNLTSQLFANLYLNELDVFMKHTMKVKRYVRYSDDFVIVHHDEEYLGSLIPLVGNFLETNLKLSLHPKKIVIRKFSQGIDFLGYVILPHFRVLRTKTRQRIMRSIREIFFQYQIGKISKKKLHQILASYFGVLQYCRATGVKREIKRCLR